MPSCSGQPTGQSSETNGIGWRPSIDVKVHAPTVAAAVSPPLLHVTTVIG